MRGVLGDRATGVFDEIIIAMGIVGGLLVIVSIIAIIVSICLAISCLKYKQCWADGRAGGAPTAG